MTDSEDPRDPSAPKESIGKFILRMTTPFELETEGIGTILARRMTVQASDAFFKRLKSLDGVEDAVLVRTYLGCVSGVPVQDAEKLPEPLTEEEVARLTHGDILSFARAYLEHIVNPDKISDPIGQMAEFVRKEREKEIEANKKLEKYVDAAFLKVSSTAEIMKQWQGLTENIKGSVGSIRDQITEVIGPSAAVRSSIEDALRDLREDRQKMMLDAIGGPQNFAGDAIKRATDYERGPSIFDHPSPPPLFDFPPISETPIGRTASAVEELREAGQRMEDAMGTVVEQAGNVSGLVGQVFTTIKEEASRSQKQTNRALRLAALSLAVSAMALAVSAYFSREGFLADRSDAKTGDDASAKVIQRLDDQNALMRALIDESRKERAAATAARQMAEPKAPAAERAPNGSLSPQQAGAKK